MPPADSSFSDGPFDHQLMKSMQSPNKKCQGGNCSGGGYTYVHGYNNYVFPNSLGTNIQFNQYGSGNTQNATYTTSRIIGTGL